MQLVVGQISRPHGVRGEVAVQVRTDDAEARFAAGSVRRPTRHRLAYRRRSALAPGPPAGRFAEIADRTAAERYRGIELLVEVDPDAKPDDADEYYDRQLVACARSPWPATRSGRSARSGTCRPKTCSWSRIGAGGQTLIPFVSEIVPEVDLAAGLVRVDPPPGLLDLGRTEQA
jgi:16S rRNA processing protein RimM